MYYEGTNQEPKLQRSSKTVREEQERWQKTTLQSRWECKKKDLTSSVECSHLSKLLAFLSHQIHHIKQWCTSLQKCMLRCRPNIPCQDKQLNNLVRHNPVDSKDIEHQWPQLTSYGAMKQKMIQWLPTTLTHIAPIKN